MAAKRPPSEPGVYPDQNLVVFGPKVKEYCEDCNSLAICREVPASKDEEETVVVCERCKTKRLGEP